jgi:hypothetical protein
MQQQQKYNAMTLFQVVGGGEASKQLYNKPVLQTSFNASAIIVPSVVDGDHAGGETHTSSSPSFPYINMVHHTQLVVDNGATGMTHHKQIVNDKIFVDNDNEKYDEVKDDDNDDNNDDDDVKGSSRSKMLTALQRTLDEESLSLPSIVYLVIDGILVYDRNRDDGLIVTKEQEQYLLFREPMIVDDFAALSMDNLKCPPPVYEDNNHLDIHAQLTHNILDEILSYSDDTCVVTLSLVCKCWYTEIGTRSPQLWKMLLQRHGWPETFTVNDDDNDGGGIDDDSPNYIAQCREAFISHYKVVRDVRALVDAIKYTTSVGVGSGGRLHECESAIHTFTGTKAHNPERDEGEMVKIWTEVKATSTGTTMAPKALTVYPKDFTLRLFEVVQGRLITNNDGSGSSNEATAPIKCRQVVCLRMVPLLISQKKKNSCKIMSFDLDDESVACLVEETIEARPSHYWEDAFEPRFHPWMIVVSREDVLCAGNEGLLEDGCLQLFDLRQSILDHILSGSEDDIRYKEMHDSLHNYLASEECILSDILIYVTSKVAACGKGNFLFVAHIYIPPRNVDYSESDSDNDDSRFHRIPSSPNGQRLFLFSTMRRDDDYGRTGKIIKSVYIDDSFGNIGKLTTNLFASRPFKNSSENASDALVTNVLISHQNTVRSVPLFSVEIQRNGTAVIRQKFDFDCGNLHHLCWKVYAVLTSTLTVFTTSNPRDSCPRLHVQTIIDSSVYSIDIGELYYNVHNLILIRDHYIAVILKEVDLTTRRRTNFFLVVVHIPTREKIYFSPLLSGAVSVDCLDDILAMNVSNLGFVFTGESARDVARLSMKAHKETPGKSTKKKKKRLASIVGLNGKKKDGFARGSCSHKS